MAKCEKCGRVISDGEKYCAVCKEKRDHGIKHWIKVGGTAVVVAVVAIVSLLGGKNK